MSETYDCRESDALLTGMRKARMALASGELAVIPTDTVYGVAADAFNPDAVQRLLDAKGRTRQSPPPVLVSGFDAVSALAARILPEVEALATAFWPGALTIIVPARRSLAWDLGETHGTVALRTPAQPLTLELLAETGPLAVSSANLTGQPAASTAAEAEAMLGESVAVYLEAGDNGERVPSTIVDASRLHTADRHLHILRQGAISREAIAEIVGDVLAEPTA